MERIDDQCLSFLPSEAGRSGEAEVLSIADAVSNEVARHRELGRPVEMSVSESAIACRVAIARGDLQRLLDNLIDNALQYGAPPVEVALDAASDTLILSVRDHGKGISANDRERALEAFAQIDPARATRGSCGLGLAIVRRIVEGCGGELSLCEAAQGGLDVRMSFPVQSPGEVR